jgi:hypothetical protein
VFPFQGLNRLVEFAPALVQHRLGEAAGDVQVEQPLQLLLVLRQQSFHGAQTVA